MAKLKNTEIDDTGFLQIPRGTTAERPSTPAVGMMRWNTDELVVEVYNGENWASIGGAPGPLYEFTSATFTPGGNTGRTGPSLSQAQSGISGSPDDSWKNNSAFFTVSGGIMEWTVPDNGDYRINTRGGRGGRDTEPGNAAVMEGEFSLTKGDKLKILVGQRGIPDSKDGTSAGGGGGTFVTTIDDTPLIIAGGGGGADGGPDGRDASTGENGVDAGDNSGGDGGTNGSGGTNGNNGSGGGAGLTGNGQDGSNGDGGEAFINGGLGGSGVRDGGFGGGGGSAGGSDGAGGGGGYSGGGGGFGSGSSDAGGGGSFNSGTNQSNSIFSNSSDPYDGYVEITKL